MQKEALSEEVNKKCRSIMEQCEENERREMKETFAHTHDLAQCITLHLTGALHASVGEIVIGVVQGMQWAKETGGALPAHGQKVLKILAECERIAENLKETQWGEDKAALLEQSMKGIMFRMTRMEQRVDHELSRHRLVM